MKLFLDASVLLTAAGSARGASRALFHLAPMAGWTLSSSAYALSEVLKNLFKFPVAATEDWAKLQSELVIVHDVLTLDRAVVFTASKDRPILFTALAWSHVLLTLDREDFASLLWKAAKPLQGAPHVAHNCWTASPRTFISVPSEKREQILRAAFPDVSLR